MWHLRTHLMWSRLYAFVIGDITWAFSDISVVLREYEEHLVSFRVNHLKACSLAGICYSLGNELSRLLHKGWVHVLEWEDKIHHYESNQVVALLEMLQRLSITLTNIYIYKPCYILWELGDLALLIFNPICTTLPLIHFPLAIWASNNFKGARSVPALDPLQ